MNLPKKFKIKSENDDTIYSVQVDGDKSIVSWDDSEGFGDVEYETSRVRRLINRGEWEIIGEPKPSLLEKLKQLTINTTTNIFIVNGQYEVYFDAFSNPAKAATDEELEKIIDAILTLNKAVNRDE